MEGEGDGPLKASDTTALAEFDAFFARPDLVWVELTRDVVELATAVRVKHGLRTPDALQAASGLQLGANHVILTGDAAFKRMAGLSVMLLARMPCGYHYTSPATTARLTVCVFESPRHPGIGHILQAVLGEE